MNNDAIFHPSLISPGERAIDGMDVYEPIVLYPFSKGFSLPLKMPSSTFYFPKEW